MSTKIMLGLGLLMLASCVAAPSKDTPHSVVVPPPVKTVTVVNKEIVVKHVPSPCQYMDSPKPLPLPVAPKIDSKTPLTDHQKLVLAQAYITSLLGYIQAEQKTDQQMYQNYINACVNLKPDKKTTG